MLFRSREHLEEHKKADAEHAVENALAEKLAELVQGDIPEAMYEREMDQKVRDFDMRLRSQGMNIQGYMQFTGMDMEAFRENFRGQAEIQVKVRLALEKIAQVEEIAPSAEDIEAQYAKFAEMYEMEVERIQAIIPEKQVAADLATEQALELVKAAAVVTEIVEETADEQE